MLPDDVQLLQQDVSAGVGRRFVHRIVAVVSGDRFLPTGRAIVQVRHGEEAALFLAELHDGLADRSSVKHIPTLLGDGRQRARQVSLPENVSRPQRLSGSVPCKNRLAGGKLAQQRVPGYCRRQVMRNRKSIVGQGDGGGEHLRQRQ